METPLNNINSTEPLKENRVENNATYSNPADMEPPVIPPKLFSLAWFSHNVGPLLIVGGLIFFILWKGLVVGDVAKVLLGLGLVIFIHELGHFLAAKWCDVHVKTFSLGFGKAIPGCEFKYGETTYKIGWVPLGGYVAMVGEGEDADNEEADEDPRSFKNKRVSQRMLIISAGVIMNMILAFVCFMIAYSHGIEERSPIIGSVEAGSPAWQSGIHSDTIIQKIENWDRPMFDDIRPIVMSAGKGEKIPFVIQNPGEDPQAVEIAPVRGADALYPTIGVLPIEELTLIKSKQIKLEPFRSGSATSKATPAFEPGDQIIACSADSDHPEPALIPPLDKTTDRSHYSSNFSEFYKRMYNMRGKPMTVRVRRFSSGEETDIQLPPAFTVTTGLRMQMGRIVAVQNNSAATKGKVLSNPNLEPGLRPLTTDFAGDKIIAVEVQDNGIKKHWEIGSTQKGDLPLDPIKLPFELENWFANKRGNQKVKLTILRPNLHSEERVELELDWNETARYHRELIGSPSSPISIPCLGLAYQVEPVVEGVETNSPAAQSGIQKGDLIKAIRIHHMNRSHAEVIEKWEEIKPSQWPFVHFGLQRLNSSNIDLRLQRGNDPSMEVSLTLLEDKEWSQIDRGLHFSGDFRLQRAENPGEVIDLGIHRTIRTVRMIYQNLYAMISGRVSTLTMSGPLTIASVSYSIAGENLWQFILFIGMINVNLAIVNFLPIPILDGGHMVFLIYEKIRGKTAPRIVQEIALWMGLLLILGLMLFVVILDIRRLI